MTKPGQGRPYAKVYTAEAIALNGGTRKPCPEHPDEGGMLWHANPDLIAGGSWECRVKTRSYGDRVSKRAYAQAQRDSGAWARSLANQLERGVQIKNSGNHHRGMTELLARLGRPRPPGLTLSLVNFDSPSVYVGRSPSHNQRPRLLSTNPEDYCWETQADNDQRDQDRRERWMVDHVARIQEKHRLPPRIEGAP